MVNISMMINVNISTKPGITENILLAFPCTIEEVATYKELILWQFYLVLR